MITETPKHNKLIIMGDMNAKIRNPKDQRETTSMGNHGMVGRKRTEDMSPDTEASYTDNRERFIELCLENDFKIVNTLFNKPANKLATYTPLEVPKWEKLTRITTNN